MCLENINFCRAISITMAPVLERNLWTGNMSPISSDPKGVDLFFRHLTLEIVLAIPASNDEK